MAVPRLGVTVVPPSRSLASAAAGLEPATGRTLRFALAMRGGVSLAVWIGGAVAELDVLRRIRIHRSGTGALHAFLLHPGEEADPRLVDRAGVYARLLADAGYDRVEFDILAGASAGGLNSVVHAVAQRAGTGLDALGLLWEEHAAIARLLRPLGWRPVDSLLRGDAYLWPGLEEVLVGVHRATEHHPDLVAEHVTVELSATVLDSDPSPSTGAAEGRGGFRFASPEPGSPAPRLGNDIPARPGAPVPDGAAEDPADDDGPGHAASLSRLAYAARASSSFPGAFEPASVWSAPTDGTLGGFPRPDLSHAFSAHRDAGELPYRVIDGGVFDNVPIDRALAAARGRRSLRHADRCLLYLDPDPPSAAGPGSSRRGLPRLARTLGATVTRLRRRETGDDEVLALSDHLDAQLLADGRLHPLAALVDEWDAAALEQRRRAYVRFRARADAALLDRLLTRPDQWQLASTLLWREALQARRPGELDALREDLARRYDALSRGPLSDPAAVEVLRGPQALFDAAACVLSWVRFLESLALRQGGAPAPLAGYDPASARACAYHLLAAAAHERDRRFRAVLVACADPAVPVTAAVPAWLAGADADDAPRAGSWAELDAVVAELRSVHGAVGEALARGREAADPAAGDWWAVWQESPWHTVPGPGTPVGAADLPPVFAAAGIPPAVSRIAYGEIRGDRGPARLDALRPLRRGWAEDRLQRALDAAGTRDATAERLRSALAPGDGRLPAQSKLAGAGLLNFRGFLATEWRTNDWWWGRLDAAAGVDAFLRGLPGPPQDRADPGSVPEPEPVDTTTDGAAVLQGSLLDELGGGDPERGRAVLDAGTDDLDRLAPGYRISLASRALRVLGRALAGTPDLPRGVWELVLFALQPVLVLAPLLLCPVRAALGLVAGAAALALVAGSGEPPGAPWPVLAGAGAAVLASSLVRSARRAGRRWSLGLQAAGGSPAVPLAAADDSTSDDTTADVTAADVTAARRGALRRAGVCGVAAASVLLPAGIAASHGHAVLTTVLLAAVLVLDRAAAVLALRVPGRGPVDEVVRAAVVVLVAVAAWGLGALVLLVRPALFPGPEVPRTLVVAAALLALGALALTGFLRPAWAGLLAAGAAVIGAVTDGLVGTLTGHGTVGLAAAVLVWAALLWWAPRETVLRSLSRDDELVTSRPGRPSARG